MTPSALTTLIQRHPRELWSDLQIAALGDTALARAESPEHVESYARAAVRNQRVSRIRQRASDRHKRRGWMQTRGVSQCDHRMSEDVEEAMAVVSEADLSHLQHELIRLCAMGMSYKTIAAMHDIPIGTVKRNLHDIRRRCNSIRKWRAV